MNESHKRLIKERYENAINEYALAFCTENGFLYDPEGWENGVFGSILVIEGKLRITFDEIRKFIDGNQPAVHAAARTDEQDFTKNESVCGTCRHGISQPAGQYVRCALHQSFHKYYDPACEVWQKGGTK